MTTPATEATQPRTWPQPGRKYLLFADLRGDQPGPRSVDQGAGPPAPPAGRGAKVVIDGYFDLRYAENPGVAFSMLQEVPGGRVLLTLLAVGGLRAGAHLPAQDAEREHAACTWRWGWWAAARSATSSTA